MAITINNLTTKKIDGTGVFDILLETTRLHLLEEFTAGRIKPTEYADVYLGAFTAILGQSAQFVLSVDRVNKEVELLEAQIQESIQNKLKIQAEVALLEDQLLTAGMARDKIQEEILVLGQQRINLASENAKIISENQKLVVEKDKVLKDIEILTQQKLNLITENSKTLKETDRIIADTALITQNKINAQLSEASITKSQEKTDSEIALLTTKNNVELAQILDIVDGQTVTGVVGKQKELFTAQIDGFKRDAEQKLLKIGMDAWSVQRSTDPDATPISGTGMENASIAQIAAKAKQGIGITG